MIWRHRYTVLVATSTWLLLCAGALVTSTGSGLAVPDWPLSYGQYFPRMEGGVLFEHGHRMVAGTVGILTVLMTIWYLIAEKRLWVRRLAVGSLVAVILQALLGGITVLFRLPTAVSVAHACLAQLFFSSTIVLSLATSPSWFREPNQGLRDFRDRRFPLKFFCLTVSLLFFLQLLLGAIMRHMGAGLAIPDFPLVFGGLIPKSFTPDIAIHYLHRVGAFVVTAATVALALRISKRHPELLSLMMWVGGLIALISVQVLLAAVVIWLRRPVPLTVAHLAVGALCLGASVAISVKAFRLGHVLNLRAA